MGLENLEWLQLQDNQISDLSPLSSLTQLNSLYVSDNQLTSLTLSDLPNLGYVQAQNNQITTINLTNVPNLYALYLDNNGLSDLTDLGASLAEQQSNNNGNWLQLGLSSNGITDVSPLSGLERMGSLDLSYNAIEDVSSLSGLTNLWWLGLRDNEITYLNGAFDTWTNGTQIDLNDNPLICSEVDAARENRNISIDFYTDCFEDTDEDGVYDRDDAFPEDPAASIDSDSDGLPDEWNLGYSESDSITNLTLDDNPFEANYDLDGDGVPNTEDRFPSDPSEWSDLDGDGIGDNADVDRDGDGIENGRDAYPDATLGCSRQIRMVMVHRIPCRDC